MKELEKENSRLKSVFVDLSLVHHALQDKVEKSCRAWQEEGAGKMYDRRA
jgi:hypothetical protein